MPSSTRAASPLTPPQRLRRLPTWLLNQVANSSTRLIVERMERSGARADFAFLAALEEFGAMSQAELGRRLGFDRSDVVAVLDRLGSDALVERSPDPQDRRRNVITVTPAGLRVLDELQDGLDQVQAALLSPLEEQERTQLVLLLQQLIDQ